MSLSSGCAFRAFAWGTPALHLALAQRSCLPEVLPRSPGGSSQRQSWPASLLTRRQMGCDCHAASPMGLSPWPAIRDAPAAGGLRFSPGPAGDDIMQGRKNEPVVVNRLIGSRKFKGSQTRGAPTLPESAHAPGCSCSNLAIHSPFPELPGTNTTLKRVVHDLSWHLSLEPKWLR
eukprot:CAMPEP_0113820204 /NCGR_PEP_ID=MMETSP0328-20130328/1123_1 /TAXON_ID=39455 /ORGANISM="Alexandrium minutum" /LENGTH=174 /DNA_ID=CAMNT_0000788139 /DNA_START=107 /DNA_END=629 /DNA_ORIENTATION=+ /assembly_acc=CAM_ASM_000350